ncbi:MAG: zf-HC2 domain-containing protein [Thiobacillus sp.]|nr:zf-HC2 domain-containing protein [Thiobacillus sp.]
MKWIPTCRETTELASRSMDERLPFADRMAMRLHLAICENCARFNRQLQDMRRLFRAETAADDDTPGLAPEARQRIESELQKKLGS